MARRGGPRFLTLVSEAVNLERSPVVPDAQRALEEIDFPSDLAWCRVATMTPVLDGITHLCIESTLYTHPFAMFVRLARPERWEGYRFDLLGAPVRRLDEPRTWPAVWVGELPKPVLILQVWRKRASEDGSPLYAEFQWRPGFTTALGSIRGIERQHSPSDTRGADRAAELLRQIAPSGRPPRSGRFRDRGELDATLRPIIERIHAAGRWPSQDRVVMDLPQLSNRADRHGEAVDPKQLRTWVKDTTGLNWSAYLESLGIQK
jgi:hypothetical protein